MKAAPLQYAGFFKWNANKEQGIPGYVLVDPVKMDAEYVRSDNPMRYVPSAYFSHNLSRHIRFAYPTVLFDPPHFEIDEDGNPMYVAPTYTYSIGLFGGKTMTGCIVVYPFDGACIRYSSDKVPEWVDLVYDGDYLCKTVNDSMQLMDGFWNSMIGQKGCRKVTEFAGDPDGGPAYNDYGYIAKDGDIWIYTGVTSVNGDSSNLGFILANERTGETRYVSCPGADEFSAMNSAEGLVQEKGYTASFPSLVTVDGEPTYLCVLKDNSGLIRLYAAVNVAQYNTAVTDATLDGCLARYKSLLSGGPVPENPTVQNKNDAPLDTSGWEETAFKLYAMQPIDISGDTYLFICDPDGRIYKALYMDVLPMMQKDLGETIRIKTDGTWFVLAE